LTLLFGKTTVQINRRSSSCRRPRLVRSLAALTFVGLAVTGANAADLEDDIFAHRFAEIIEPLLPRVQGEFQLPAFALSSQLAWLLSELDANENTTAAEVEARFVSAYDPVNMSNFINSLRTTQPNARIVDLIGISPVRATFVIEGDNPDSSLGFVTFGVRYTAPGLINLFGVQPFGGTVQFPDDQTRTLSEAADHFQTLGASNSLFIGRINSNNQCEGVVERLPDTPRALGSIFKKWVLAAVGERLNQGQSQPEDPITLVAAERASGGIINNEPLGTEFTVRDMAIMMMADSDNTSTDHLHELVGREAVADILTAYGIVETDQLLPFLNISEQFHVFRSFDLATALSYVNGDLPFRTQFLNDQILPLGPSFQASNPFFHESLLSTGTWSASARDICRTLAGMHALPRASAGFQVVNQALGYQAALPGVRADWGRVWYKGGSLSSGATGLHVLTGAWLLQKEGESKPWVVVGLTNDSAGGIDIFQVNSVLSRIIELIGDVP
jgi:hypothetical protein